MPETSWVGLFREYAYGQLHCHDRLPHLSQFLAETSVHGAPHPESDDSATDTDKPPKRVKRMSRVYKQRGEVTGTYLVIPSCAVRVSECHLLITLRWPSEDSTKYVRHWFQLRHLYLSIPLHMEQLLIEAAPPDINCFSYRPALQSPDVVSLIATGAQVSWGSPEPLLEMPAWLAMLRRLDRVKASGPKCMINLDQFPDVVFNHYGCSVEDHS